VRVDGVAFDYFAARIRIPAHIKDPMYMSYLIVCGIALAAIWGVGSILLLLCLDQQTSSDLEDLIHRLEQLRLHFENLLVIGADPTELDLEELQALLRECDTYT
jgi:hypothetical protein